ncbi:MAG: hypothetical protein JSW17_01840, partial [Candidatus Omnitrophota bacterium]
MARVNKSKITIIRLEPEDVDEKPKKKKASGQPVRGTGKPRKKKGLVDKSIDPKPVFDETGV